MIKRERFEALHAAVNRRLRLYVARVVGDVMLADDIAQESYLRLLQSASNRLTDEQLRSYLFTTATNLVRDSWRRGSVTGRWLPMDEADAVESDMIDSAEIRIDVERTMEHLSLMQRSLLWLAYVEGYSHRELARLHGLKDRSVRVLLYRARQAFIRHYQPTLIDRREES